MRYRTLSLAVALLAAPIAVQAQPFHGIYIGAGAGYNLPIDIGAATNLVLPSTSTDLKTTGGFVGLASVGYGLRQRHALRNRGQLPARQCQWCDRTFRHRRHGKIADVCSHGQCAV